MRYYYKDNKGNLFNYKSERLEEGYTQITEEEFNSILQSRVPKPTEEQKAKMEKARKIAELKKKLSETDYIVLKIAEAQADNDTEKVSALKTTYAEQLIKRKEAREKINELEVK